MIRRSAPALLCLAVLLVAARLSAAHSNFRVDEDATRFSPRGERAELSLAYDNAAGRGFAARVTAELVDPRGVVRARVEREEVLKEGRGALELALPFRLSSLAEAERRELPWFRVRYRVAPGAETPAPAAEGVVSLSSITPDLFEMHVSTPSYAFDGMRFRARARATHPATRLPARGVRLEAVLTLDDEAETTLRAAAVTGAEGDALLDFELPRAPADEEEVKLVVRGRRGEVTQEVADETPIERYADIIVGSDKPLYQPGQTVRLRALLRDPFAHRVLPDAEVTLKVQDPDGGVVFQTVLRASRFGVAAADWPTPEGTRLGTYTAVFEIGEGPYESHAGAASFNVSRYELPTFAVAVEPDRKFYLPGEDASVTVRADYLFGRPVPRGRVRVVRERERTWDYGRQRWEVKEGRTFEGEADEEGRLRVRLPLAEEHAELAREGGEGRIRDPEFAAYVTDPSTNRTEQRRFALRLTREPVHVYVVAPEPGPTAGFPTDFYLTTFYADGTPAVCDVTVAEAPETAPVTQGASPAPAPRALTSVRTNRYGLAKVSGLTLAETEDEAARLVFIARDAQGREGRATEHFYFNDGTGVRIETDKTIYRAGEPLRIRLSSNRAEGLLALEVVQRQRLLHTQTVRLRGGRAAVVVPPRREFRDAVTIFAHAVPQAVADDEPKPAAHAVIFPRAEGLRFDVRLDRREYRPGQEARADIRVRDAEGREVESALGVVVTDRAVSERARTDAEFGRAPEDFVSAFRQRLGEGDGLSGVTRADLARLDLKQPVPQDLDLLAEILLNTDRPYGFDTNDAGYERDQRAVFKTLLAEQLKPLRDALAAAYERRGEYPRDEASLRRLLDAAGVRLDELRDPWGRPYEPRFGTRRELDFFELVSTSADKRRETGDDFVALEQTWAYFRPAGLVIERVVKDYFQRTGRPVRDRETLREELRRDGFDLDALRDPWGRPYEVSFTAGGRELNVGFRSRGPDGALAGGGLGDDFTAWQVSVNYFQEEERRIRRALAAATAATGRFPRDEAEFREALRRAGVGPQALEDPWGRPYRIAFTPRPWPGGQLTVRVYPRAAEHAAKEVAQTKVSQGLYTVVLSSLGPDGEPGSYDDFNVADFAQVQEERSMPAEPRPAPSPGAGELAGVVHDMNGAAVAGALVRVERAPGVGTRETKTDDEGRFRFADLASGDYELLITSTGFVSQQVVSLSVFDAHVTDVRAVLAVGAVGETVEVTATADNVVQTQSAMLEGVAAPGLRHTALRRDADTPARSVETPRLREYFPETLLWQPHLETDAAGRASVRFKLADNITTWKLAVVGSTLDGELGLAEADLTAFQPFFVEHDPPRVLTEGDEISLPVVLRNYLARPQEVGVEIKPESWFALLGPSRRRARVAAESSARETFDFRAVASVKEGRQRVTALGSDESDAVEKTVSVHPDGEEVVETTTQLLGTGGAFDLDFPAETTVGTARAELKLYPGLSSHLAEGVEAIMSRPYGCGEQTISSTYPSLLVLRHQRARAAGGETPAVVRRAERYLREGYERLLNYRTPPGGFGYWADRSEPDVALTAYALKFLTDARAVFEVDEEVVEGARRWLTQQARADGTWNGRINGSGAPASSSVTRLTAYVARVLAEAGGDRANVAEKANDVEKATASVGEKATASVGGDKATTTVSSDKAAPAVSVEQAPASVRGGQTTASVRDGQATAAVGGARAADGGEAARASAALERALDFLARRVEKSDDPYLLASFVLAARARGSHAEAADVAARRLLALRHDEAGLSFWDVPGETPFHGWGLAGRIEATALAARALAHPSAGDEGRGAARRALLFLLRGKDRFGVWHSTQATVNVLDALAAVTGPRDAAGVAADIYVNGRHATNVTLLGSDLGAPVAFDLTPHLNAPGRNRVEVRLASGADDTAAQLVSTHYAPWDTAARRAPAAGRPTLKVSFDRTETEAGQPVSCRVEASGGAGGGGMLLAEVGLPPGAEVDRATLERARSDADSRLYRYDVLPDRVVLYLWPERARPVSLGFAFRPRYGLRALTAPSHIYDYYNPEARAVVPPTRFVVR